MMSQTSTRYFRVRPWELAVLAAVLASPIAVVSRLRAEGARGQPAGPEAATSFVALVCGVPLARAQALSAPARANDGTWRVQCLAGDDTVEVSGGSASGQMSVRWCYHKDGAPGEDVSREVAQAAATVLVRRSFGPDAERLRLIKAQALPMGVYFFIWRGEREGVASGDMAVIVVDRAGGRIRSYSERKAPDRGGLALVKIPRDRAEETARKALAKRGTVVGGVRTGQALLVLSSPLAPGQGPVWQFEFVGTDPQRPSAPLTAFIDAVTGEEISPPSCGPDVDARRRP